MSCRFYERRIVKNKFIGHNAPPTLLDICLLKQQGIQRELEIEQALSGLRLQRGRNSDNCPVAPTAQWDKCPFKEEP